MFPEVDVPMRFTARGWRSRVHPCSSPDLITSDLRGEDLVGFELLLGQPVVGFGWEGFVVANIVRGCRDMAPGGTTVRRAAPRSSW